MADSLDFSAAEAALVTHLISDVAEFTTDNMKAHDFDAVYVNTMDDPASDFFAWTDYAGGQNQGRGIWAHRVLLSVGIFFSDGANVLDDNIRTIVDAVTASLLPDSNLSGAVESARIESVLSPVPWQNTENDLPHVVIAFNVLMEERMPLGC